MSVSDVLGYMVNTMTAKNWIQDYLMSDDGKRRCLLGHVEKCMELSEDNTGDIVSKREVCEFIVSVIERDTHHHAITKFNDDPATSFEDVQLVVKQAYLAALKDES